MKCNHCKNPLPSDGVVCKFCGAMMDSKQISYQNKMKENQNKKITLLSEKYGVDRNIEYRKPKEKKLLGAIIIIIILLILIILTILTNI